MKVVQIASLGPQGPTGPQGDKGNPGELASAENLTITGSLFVSGANGNITASGDISASGMLFTSLSLDSSANNTVMYNTSSGKFFFTGSYGGGGGGGGDRTFANVITTDLTASGNISASGTIRATNTISNNLISDNFKSTANSDDIELIVVGGQAISMGQVSGGGGPTPLKLFTNQQESLRLSPNLTITASGTITGPTASFGIYLGDGSQLEGVQSTIDSSSFAITGSDVIFANITSSGNISASGTITGNTFTIGNKTYAIYHEGTNSLRMGTSAVGMTFMSQEFIKYSTNITSSGNVSASGYISASKVLATTGSFDNLSFGGTFSGNAEFDDLSIQGNLDLGGTGVPTIESDSNLILSASNGAVIIKDTLNVTNISASGYVSASQIMTDELNVIGTGIPSINSPTNIILSASNAVVIKNNLHLTATTTASISTPANGYIVYDSSSHKFRGYANGSWVDLH